MEVTPNPADPAGIVAQGVSNQGQISSPSEATLPAPPGRSWRVNVGKASSPADSTGSSQVQIGPVSNGQTWFVEFVRVQNNSTTPTAVEFFKNDVNALNSIDSSPVNAVGGNDNWFSAPGSPGYWLGEGETLIVVWSDGDVGAVGTVNAQVKVYG